MSSHHEPDAAARELYEALPDWLPRMRHPAQLWPQLWVMVSDVLEDLPRERHAHVSRKVLQLMEREGVDMRHGGEVLQRLRELAEFDDDRFDG